MSENTLPMRQISHPSVDGINTDLSRGVKVEAGASALDGMHLAAQSGRVEMSWRLRNIV